eukprot:TRINITY_DN17475_c0_g1_i1.p1 TRINITY_DN17475_c0_g1~~TRINITY_DN17475_c0_g1_i1.p1  ORF type:complete len:871 (+),score=228.62 TRINITY_DN17475_c0_g1_i1:514-3126(+)
MIVQESWYRVAPRTHIIVVKSIESVGQSYEAAFVITPVDSADPHLRSASHVSLITRVQFEHRLKALVDQFNVSSVVSVETLYGLNSYLRTLSTSDLNRIKSLPVGGDPTAGNDAKAQDLEQEREYRELLREAFANVLKEKDDMATYKLVLEKNGAKVYKKEGIADKTILGFKATMKMEKSLDVIMHFLSDITNKPSYDILCAKAGFVYHYSDITKLIRQEFRSMWPLTARDFLSVASIFPLFSTPGAFALITKSVMSDLLPLDPKYQRADILFGGYVFEPLDGGNSTMVTFVARSSFGMELPGFVVDVAVSNNGMHLSNIRNLTRDIDPNSIPDNNYVFEAISKSDGISVEKIRSHAFDWLESKDDEKKDYPPSPVMVEHGESKEHQHYVELVNKAMDEIYKQAMDNSWEYVQEDQAVKIFRKKTESATVPLVMGEGFIDADPFLILSLMGDLSRKQRWDEMFASGKDVEEIDPVTKIVYQCYRAVWPTAARDFCNVTSFRLLDDGTLIAGAVSAEHPDLPLIKSNVRADLRYGGMVATPVPTGGCTVRYIIHLDLCGSIPAFLIDMMSTKQPLIVAALRKALVDLNAKDIYDPNILRNNWAVYVRRKNGIAEEEVKEIPLEREEEKKLEAKEDPQTPKSSEELGTESTSQDGGEAEGVRNLMFLEAAEEATTALLEAYDPHGPWTLIFEKSGVQVYQRFVQTSPIPVIKGEGIINASPRDIAGVLANLERRKWYDEFFTSSKLLSVVETNTKVYQMIYQAKELCRGGSRDFVLVDHWRELPDGRIVFASKSVDHPGASSRKAAVRAEILFAGWVIEPIVSPQDQKGKGARSRVRYLTQVDLKGNLAPWVTSLMVKQQPLLIQQIDKLFQ